MKSLPLFIFLFLPLFSCITPAAIETSQVIPKNEFQLISTINKAKEFYQRGKLDLAELEYRKALKANPNLTMVYNDLAVIYEQTDRLDEAKKLYQKSLGLDQRNFIALKNLAKINFRLENYEESIKQFEEALQIVSSLNAVALKNLSSKNWGAKDYQELYGLISVAYFNVGYFDEALCNSEKIVTLGLSNDSVIQYERFLSALDRVSAAKSFLNSKVTINADIPADLLFDYAIVLYFNADYIGAGQKLELCKISNSFNAVDKVQFNLFELLLLGKQQKNSELLEKISELFEVSPEICKRALAIPDYRPSAFEKETKQLLKEICKNERE